LQYSHICWNNRVATTPYSLHIFEKATPFETVTRARRKIQEEGKYLPTDPEVLRKRRKLAEVYRRAMPQV